MEVRKGIAVSPGISIARAVVLGHEDIEVHRRFVSSHEVEHEIERLDRAVQDAVEETNRDAARLGDDLSIPRQILESHREIIRDPGLRKQVVERIREKRNSAEYALSLVLRGYAERFAAMESAYVTERVHDVDEIERKLLAHLQGRPFKHLKEEKGEVVIIAHNLSPGETAALDRDKVKGFGIDVGGRTSHTAIMARAMQIPAVVGLEDISHVVSGGETVVIDGYSGQVIIDPDAATLEAFRTKAVSSRAFYRQLEDEIRWPAETIDGYRVYLAANIEFPEEISSALEWGAAGIGLYRTEFLYEHGEPDEAKHLEIYRRALKALRGRELVIRTLDAGADKFHKESHGVHEPNPFLGCRSIRLCFQRPELFRSQVRAVLRLSNEGRLKLLLPMVSSLDEIRMARSVIEDVKSELAAEGVQFNASLPVGIMVEVPSIALIADRAALEVDFFSIGTNDLVQYSLAVDRVNERVAHLYQPTHPAILRLMKGVIDASRDVGIHVSICGEMCSDPLFTVLLLGLGLRSFSLSPISIPTVKRVIRQVTMLDAEGIATECLGCETADDCRRVLEKRMMDLLPEYY